MASLFGDDESDDEEEKRLESNGVMAFHSGTEEALFIYLESKCENANQQFSSVLDLLQIVDSYCFQRHWMMHIGPQKAKYLSEAIEKIKNYHLDIPLNILELGSYCGYSSVIIASHLRKRDIRQGIDHLTGKNHSKLISIEPDDLCVKWTKRMIEMAGLQDYVTVLQTTVDSPDFFTLASKSISDSLSYYQSFDLLFIDHDKARYLEDLILLEHGHLGEDEIPMLGAGCVVVADNVLSFNSPLQDYLDHVRNVENDVSSQFVESRLFEDQIEYAVSTANDSDTVDGVEVSIMR